VGVAGSLAGAGSVRLVGRVRVAGRARVAGRVRVVGPVRVTGGPRVAGAVPASGAGTAEAAGAVSDQDAAEDRAARPGHPAVMEAGDIPLGMESLNVSLPIYRDHKIKILALTSAQRLSFAPELPTIAETYPGYDLGIWQSIVAPAGTPRAIVERLSAALNKVMAMPQVRERLLGAAVEPAKSNTPEEFAAFIRAQAETRAKVIKAVGMKLD